MTSDPAPPEEMLIREIYPSLRRFAAVVGPYEVSPDDLVHDALVSALRGGSLSRLDHPLAYLRRAVLSISSNHRRHFDRQHRALQLLSSSQDETVIDSRPSDVEDLLDLEPVERAVLYLHAVEGETLADIAPMVGRRAATVRQIYVRTARKLRTRLSQECWE